MDNPREPPFQTLAARFKLGKLIGAGAFGNVYSATDKDTGSEVAVKLASLDNAEFFEKEVEIYKTLSQIKKPGIPRLIWNGYCGGYYALVMDRLGHSLERIVREKGQSLSLRTILHVADSLVSLLEDIHSYDVIHRDLKPENILVGHKDTSTIYLIDYGLAVNRSRDTFYPKGSSSSSSLCGTPRYASLGSHHGLRPSPKDDLESLGYVLIELFHGSLPWQGLSKEYAGRSGEYENKVCSLKEAFSVHDLRMEQSDLFASYFEYVRSLSNHDKPDYGYLQSLFRDVAIKQGFLAAGYLTWTSDPEITTSAASTSDVCEESDQSEGEDSSSSSSASASSSPPSSESSHTDPQPKDCDPVTGDKEDARSDSDRPESQEGPKP